MKCLHAKALALAISLAGGAALEVRAQESFTAPSLLPIPQVASYGVQQTAALNRYQPEDNGPIGAGVPRNGDLPPAPPPLSDPLPSSPYEAAMGGYWGDASVGCNSCAAEACAPCYPRSCWWAGANFLYFARDSEDYRQLSFDDTDLLGAVLDTDSANMNTSPGFEVSIGRWFACGAVGVELSYWGIFPENQDQTVLAGSLVGNLNTVMDFAPLNIGADNVNDLYDAAQAHRVRRSWEMHNIELNALQGYGYSGRSFDVSFIGGVRYFQFDEGFQYASADGSPVFGVDPDNEVYYDIDVENNLVGFQLGATGNYYMGQRVRLHATPKVGLYNNHISHNQRIYNVNGVAVVGAGNPLAGEAYDVSGTKDDISFLAEIDLGVDYRLGRRWVLNAGYRAVAMTGVAYATTQIPPNFADLPGVRDIDNDESLILHGGYVGATYLW